ncbi:DUF1127 domain-containing protein [Hahella ganghwensis]|uniref:DUF1127 domain-containing protein n=1 Tax=Hahella ganghwensis TaxID=286420 RepID=UPI0003759742|nr:DUF1127 domain-containing protein [Hahella ganghwensis]
MSVQVDRINHSSNFTDHTVAGQSHGFLSQFIGHPVIAVLSQWKHNYQTRRQLASLPDAILEDIGLSQAQVKKELNKKFWQD